MPQEVGGFDVIANARPGRARTHASRGLLPCELALLDRDHMSAAEVQAGLVVVMHAAAQSQPVDGGAPAARQGRVVVKLQEGLRFAAPALRANKGAAMPVAFTDGPSNCRWNVP